MRTIILLIVISSISIRLHAQFIYIPDSNFKSYLVGNNLINTNGDNQIQQNEASSFSGSIECNNMNISDLTGIEAFTSLTILNCRENQLSSLDVSSNIALVELWCGVNQLFSLDLSANSSLTYLDCNENYISSLDVSGCPMLTILGCQENFLTTLDVSENTELIELWCDMNQLSSLDVSLNTSLTLLSCVENQLSSLDVSTNTALTKLWCWGNDLSTLNLSTLSLLSDLSCGWNQLASIDVSSNPLLAYLECEGNFLISLDLSLNPELIALYISYNSQLVELNLQNGNNSNIVLINAIQNQNMICLQVDDVTYCTNNWTDTTYYNFDEKTRFFINCMGQASVKIMPEQGLPTLHPNPANEMVHIEGLPIASIVTVFDLNGKNVLETRVSETEMNLNVDLLNNGVYVIQFTRNNEIIGSQKLIVNK